jgi:putative two-component system response regulator
MADSEFVAGRRRDQPSRVLVVDDHPLNRQLLEAYLATVDCSVLTAASGEAALEIFAAQRPDLVLLDVDMPGLDGFEVCRRLKATPEGRLVPVVMITALNQVGDRVTALEAGADDFMSKPVERSELVARTRSALRLKATYDNLESAERVIYSLAAAVEAKDSYTEAHTHRVGLSSRRLGQRVGLADDDLDALLRGGMIHDLGKIGIADAILQKPGLLSPEEQHEMQRHPELGERIARPLGSATELLPIIRHHHEAYDGSGYPDGLRGHEIPLTARIVAICDGFDALTSTRPYRSGRSTSDAVDILLAGRGKQWDPDLVDVFVAALQPAGHNGSAGG